MNFYRIFCVLIITLIYNVCDVNGLPFWKKKTSTTTSAPTTENSPIAIPLDEPMVSKVIKLFY